MDVEQMIEDNMGLVYKQLHKFNRANDEDAMSVAVEALWKAIITYDQSKDVKLSTYASVCIYNAITHYLRPLANKSRPIILSYDNTVQDEEDELTFLDIMTTNENPESLLIETESYEKVLIAYERALLKLRSAKAREVIEYWRKSDYTAKQMEIAEAVGVSQAVVSRAINTFRYRLKLELEELKC